MKSQSIPARYVKILGGRNTKKTVTHFAGSVSEASAGGRLKKIE